MARLLLLIWFVMVMGLAMGEELKGSDGISAHRDVSGVAEPPVLSREEASEGESETNQMAEGPDIRRLGMHHHHHSPDKSIAGGGVIIGGLATAIFAAVFCYIRVTRKSGNVDTTNGSKV